VGDNKHETMHTLSIIFGFIALALAIGIGTAPAAPVPAPAQQAFVLHPKGSRSRRNGKQQVVKVPEVTSETFLCVFDVGYT
jgi:hypothetical protein